MKKEIIAIALLATSILAGCSTKPKKSEQVTEKEKEIVEQRNLGMELAEKGEKYYKAVTKQVKEQLGVESEPGISKEFLKKYIVAQTGSEMDADQIIRVLDLDYQKEADKTVDAILELSAKTAGVTKDDLIEYSKKTDAIRSSIETGLKELKFSDKIIEKALSILG